MSLNWIKPIPERETVLFNTPKAKHRDAPKYINGTGQKDQKQRLTPNVSNMIKSQDNEGQNQANSIKIMDIYESFMPQVTEEDTVQSYFD